VLLFVDLMQLCWECYGCQTSCYWIQLLL
jgi:hypothetical protein